MTGAALVGGVDLGATRVRAAVAEPDGTLLARAERDTPAGDGATVADAVAATLEAACTDAGLTPRALAAVGAGTVGPLADAGAGVVADPPNLPGVDRLALGDRLRGLTGGPVVVHNDAVAGLLAERAAGAPPDTVYLTLSTGIGAGASVDGHVLEGQGGNAAEVGHLVVAPDGALRCGCGAVGHWEAYCAGARLPAHARHLARERGVATDLALAELTTERLVAAGAADPLADRVLDRVAHLNAVGLAALVHAYDPALVAVGGGVARHAAGRVLDPAVEALSDHLLVDAPTVRLTTLEGPVLRGALAAAGTAAAGDADAGGDPAVDGDSSGEDARPDDG